MEFDLDARDMWIDVYSALSHDRTGLLAAVTSRAEAQTLRLACQYALIDGSATIGAPHLSAALECWRYCEDSAEFIFANAVGDSTADQIMVGLKQCPKGLTRDEIGTIIFARHKPADEITRSLDTLRRLGRVGAIEEKTRGRSATRWRLIEETGDARYARKAR